MAIPDCGTRSAFLRWSPSATSATPRPSTPVPTEDALGPDTALLLALVGVVSGAINVFAGGGGLLALPALVLAAELSPAVANGTFRVAVLAQSIAAVIRLRRLDAGSSRAILGPGIPVMLGALAGAWHATHLDDAGTRRLILGACLLATAAWVVGEARLAAAGVADEVATPPSEAAAASTGAPGPMDATPSSNVAARDGRGIGLWLALLVAGWYGGLIQAGVGFLLLLVLRRFGRLPLLTANALKLELVLLFTPLALLTFAADGRVDWLSGAVLGIGMAGGAWVATGWALGEGAAAAVRWTTAAMVLAALWQLWPGSAP